METKFKCFGTPLSFPLEIDGDWVRIQCGIDGEPNYIFGLPGLKEFFEAGAGIYSRDKDGKPTQTLQQWQDWYEAQKKERIEVSKQIEEIKSLTQKVRFKI